MPIAAKSDGTPELGIGTDQVSTIIVLARAVDVKEADSDPDEGSNPTDDGEADVLEDKPNDATRAELASFIRALNGEEQITLVALAWVGRGTYDISQWGEAVETARSEHNNRTAQYLLGLPLLGDYLANGLEAFGEQFNENVVN